jgi:endonuclease/exonuclease/phosphatase family metal-dependent hydrolase
VVGFTEAPAGDWAKRVGQILGMDHQFRGETSSANHKDKYKIILSRTPLEETKEVMLPGSGWQPASAVRAVSTIHGIRFAIYCLHICASKEKGGQAFHLADEVLAKETEPHVLVMGDFNNQMSDAAMLHLKKTGLKATWDSLPVDLAKSFTWNAKDPKSREGVIDHILYRESSRATVTAGGIIELEKPLSDHKPVWAELRMP